MSRFFAVRPRGSILIIDFRNDGSFDLPLSGALALVINVIMFIQVFARRAREGGLAGMCSVTAGKLITRRRIGIVYGNNTIRQRDFITRIWGGQLFVRANCSDTSAGHENAFIESQFCFLITCRFR